MSNNDPDAVECCCMRCHIVRCCTHCWFFLACCGFVFVSSLPRIFTILDIIGCLFIYIFNSSTHFADEMASWDFRSEGFSVVVFSVVRSVLLFFTYAYRFHLSPKTVLVATTAMAVSAAHLIAKLALLTNSKLLPLIVYAFSATILEYVSFMLVKRRRMQLQQGAPAAATTQSRVGKVASPQERYRPLTESPSSFSKLPEAEDKADEPADLADPDSSFATVEGLTVHYKLWIRPTSASTSLLQDAPLPAFILLHGFGGSVGSWRMVWSELCQSASLVMAFDRPGFGLTSRLLPKGDNKEDYGIYVVRGPDGVNRSHTQANPYTPEYSVSLIVKMMTLLKVFIVLFVFISFLIVKFSY
jgi:hypothetical protein